MTDVDIDSIIRNYAAGLPFRGTSSRFMTVLGPPRPHRRTIQVPSNSRTLMPTSLTDAVITLGRVQAPTGSA